MAVGSAFDPQYKAWGRMIAKQGVVCVMVDFRNCELPSQSNPDLSAFPGGLNDCYAGLKWVYENAEKLGVDRDRICVRSVYFKTKTIATQC